MFLSNLYRQLVTKLPETDCGTCLRIRYQAGKAILAFETAASKALSFEVGKEVDESRIPKETPVCVELTQLAPKDIVSYREALKLTQEQFAAKFGLSVKTVRAWEEGAEKIEIEKMDLTLGPKEAVST